MFAPMKIALAQIQSFAGDTPYNISRHEQWISLAANHHCDLIVFPELSVTAYDTSRIHELAMPPDDPRLERFQELSDRNDMVICVGVPLRTSSGITISMIIFQPEEAPQIYHKKYLHADEIPFFLAGENEEVTLDRHPEIAPAICYETSVPEHLTTAVGAGAKFYLASVVKFADGVQRAFERLPGMAQTHRITVLMANAVGNADNGVSAGNSSVWTSDGRLAGQLDAVEEGLLVYDTQAGSTQKIVVNELAS